jgi:hypothetical protein
MRDQPFTSSTMLSGGPDYLKTMSLISTSGAKPSSAGPPKVVSCHRFITSKPISPKKSAASSSVQQRLSSRNRTNSAIMKTILGGTHSSQHRPESGTMVRSLEKRAAVSSSQVTQANSSYRPMNMRNSSSQ